ncbi:protein kinase [Streptosporangium sp. NPDC048047]|uniref:serine/threonine-protein kinase n=1 Tax=Streptosporangium sp. NPDC048047 TaxID=3155748 RepID=UPI003446CF50
MRIGHGETSGPSHAPDGSHVPGGPGAPTGSHAPDATGALGGPGLPGGPGMPDATGELGGPGALGGPGVPEGGSRLLAGRYRLLSPLGAGGMGVVWRARDELLHQSVAVKEVSLPAHLSVQDREERLRRTLREARTAAALRDHPGIVTVYDVVEEDDRPWIIMALVEGSTLSGAIRARRRLPEAEVAVIGRQVIAALIAAEAAGIVHRDVKPANILLGDGQAVLTDFGISAAADDHTDLTGTGRLVGTIPYLAPERFAGLPASAATDLWAVGVTLYEAVEGRKPFARGSTAATIASIINGLPDPAEHAGRLRPVIEGLLRKDPAERLTAAEALALLAPVVATGAAAPSPATGPGRAEGRDRTAGPGRSPAKADIPVTQAGEQDSWAGTPSPRPGERAAARRYAAADEPGSAARRADAESRIPGTAGSRHPGTAEPHDSNTVKPQDPGAADSRIPGATDPRDRSEAGPRDLSDTEPRGRTITPRWSSWAAGAGSRARKTAAAGTGYVRTLTATAPKRLRAPLPGAQAVAAWSRALLTGDTARRRSLMSAAAGTAGLRARAAVATGAALLATMVTIAVVVVVVAAQAGAPGEGTGRTSTVAEGSAMSTVPTSGPAVGRTPAAAANRTPGSGPGGTAAPAASPGPDGTTGPSGSPSPGFTGEPAAPATPPPGFRLYRDGRHRFSLAVPEGWHREVRKSQVGWASGKSKSPSVRLLGVLADPGKKEKRSPERILAELRDGLKPLLMERGSYRELRKGPVAFPGGKGAELEFRFTRKGSPKQIRFYARCLVRDGGGAGMFWFSTPAERSGATSYINTFASTFRLG